MAKTAKYDTCLGVPVNPKLKENKIEFSRQGIKLVEMCPKSAEKTRKLLCDMARRDPRHIRKHGDSFQRYNPGFNDGKKRD